MKKGLRVLLSVLFLCCLTVLTAGLFGFVSTGNGPETPGNMIGTEEIRPDISQSREEMGDNLHRFADLRAGPLPPDLQMTAAATDAETEPDTSTNSDGLGKIAGIPVHHLLLFISGLSIAIALLIELHFSHRRREKQQK